MARSIDRFEKELDSFLFAFESGEAIESVRNVATRALTGVVFKTPVDTGRARGNWITSVNTSPTDPNENADAGGSSVVSSGAMVIKEAKIGDTIYITNNLPYILRLENGWSKQAPNGMVSVTIQELEALYGK